MVQIKRIDLLVKFCVKNANSTGDLFVNKVQAKGRKSKRVKHWKISAKIADERVRGHL